MNYEALLSINPFFHTHTTHKVAFYDGISCRIVVDENASIHMAKNI